MRLPIILILSCFLTSNAVAVIYVWQDNDGRKYYGSECPKQSCSEVQLGTTSTFHSNPVKTEATTEEEIESKPIITTTDLPVIPPSLTIESEKCNDSIADTIGVDMVDPYSATESTPLTSSQLRDITRLQESLTGRWRGTMNEEVCKGTEKAHFSEHNQYSLSLKVSKNTKGRYEYQASYSGQNKNNFDEKVRILISDEKLHSGEGEIQTSSRKWEVKLLKSTSDELVFVRQYRSRLAGSSQSHMVLRSYNYMRGKIQIKELRYTHDKLWLIRTMTVKK